MAEEQSNELKVTADVLERIAKYLNVSIEKGNSQAEVDMASRMAQKEMLKYNLSVSDIKGKDKDPVAEAGLKTLSTTSIHHDWALKLLEGICETNFCKVFAIVNRRPERPEYDPQIDNYYESRGYVKYGKGWRKSQPVTHVELLGREHNIAFVEYLYSYLFRAIRRECLDSRPDYARSDSYESDIWQTQYGEGCVVSVLNRLREQRRADEGEAPEGSMALIVALDAEVEDAWYMKKYGKTKAEYDAKRAKDLEDSRQWSAGFDAAMERQEVADLEAQTERFQDGYKIGQEERKAADNAPLPKPADATWTQTKAYKSSYRGGNRREKRTNDDAYHEGRVKGNELPIREGINAGSVQPKERRVG